MLFDGVDKIRETRSSPGCIRAAGFEAFIGLSRHRVRHLRFDTDFKTGRQSPRSNFLIWQENGAAQLGAVMGLAPTSQHFRSDV